MADRDHDREQVHGQPRAGRRVTVQEAAGLLGTTVEAVRHRLRRGTLDGEKVDDRVYVILDGDHESTDQPGAGRGRTSGQPQPDEQPAELVEELREHVADLREQLREERQANRENRRIIAGLIERVPELAAASPPEPRGSRETATHDQPGTRTPAGHTTPQTGAQRRPWWRRLIGS